MHHQIHSLSLWSRVVIFDFALIAEIFCDVTVLCYVNMILCFEHETAIADQKIELVSFCGHLGLHICFLYNSSA